MSAQVCGCDPTWKGYRLEGGELTAIIGWVCDQHRREGKKGGTPATKDALGRKRCPKCAVFSLAADYHLSNRRAGWLAEDGTYRQSYCKRGQATDRIRQGRARVAELANIKTTQGCADCGYNQHPAALDFHHTGDKSFSVSAAACSGASMTRLKQEIAQCIVLCANCHRIRHASN